MQESIFRKTDLRFAVLLPGCASLSPYGKPFDINCGTGARWISGSGPLLTMQGKYMESDTGERIRSKGGN